MRILFVLPGLHAVERGAEIAFIAIASELARRGHDVTCIGSGPAIDGRPYRYLRSPKVSREHFERFPKLPILRMETSWEELTFLPGLLRQYRPADYDVTVTCSYPFSNWVLRAIGGARRPKHIFVTQNGDWAATAQNSEYRWFGCDGMVCINPDYFDRNNENFPCALIPNGVDLSRFTPGPAERHRFGLPENCPIVLMVSAMIESKNVDGGIEAVARLPDAHLVVAGGGPMRDELQKLADRLMPGRYHPILVKSEEMPALYRSADVFLHLSKTELFGNAYVEAMACGVPVVAYDLPRTRWIVGSDAFLSGLDSGDITKHVLEALSADSHRRDAMTLRAADFGWDRISERYLAFFEQIIAGHGDSGPA